MEEEFPHVHCRDSLIPISFRLTSPKQQKLVFRRDSVRHFSAPQHLPSIEQVTLTKRLGIYISETSSAAAHVKHVPLVANQRLYLLTLLKSRVLSRDALRVIFTAIVLSVVTFALPSFAEQLSKGDKARFESFRRGFCCQTFSIDELILAAYKIFRQMSNIKQCLHPLLSNHKNSKIRKSLKNRGHNYIIFILSYIETNLLKTMSVFIHLVFYLFLYCVLFFIF